MTKFTQPLVQAALKLADSDHSKLGERELELYGRSSRRLRAFINNVCSKDHTNYVEIGVDRGATIISATYGNSTCKAIGIENFTYDEKEHKKFAQTEKQEKDGSITTTPSTWGNMRNHLHTNVKRYETLSTGVGMGSIDIIEEDFQKVDWKALPKADIVFFDVKPLSDEIYADFFEKVVPHLSATCILIFSNYSNSLHAEQLTNAFEAHKDVIKPVWKEQRISSGLSDATQYFSGIAVFGVIKTTNPLIKANTEVKANTTVGVSK